MIAPKHQKTALREDPMQLLLGYYWENGKENGNYYDGVI